MKGLKLVIAAVALILTGMNFATPLFVYWTLVTLYWALNALT